MSKLEELETGVMFWAGGDPGKMLASLTRLGVRCGQIGIPGDLDLSCVSEWSRALREADFTVYTVFAAYTGEDYADVPTVERTVGFLPLSTRAEREQRTYEVSDFAAGIGAPSIATHIGLVPEDSQHPNYTALREMVKRICDHAAKHKQTFALETGQESAHALLSFIQDVRRENLGINFDPANMIMYGTGDPIEALGVLREHVLSVHCKDGDWPPPGDANALGKERPLGAGAVGMERFLNQLREISYKGPLAIEREGVDPAQWRLDIEAGIGLLENVKRSTVKRS
jgi:sugar phosphate isomerase/epimerase